MLQKTFLYSFLIIFTVLGSCKSPAPKPTTPEPQTVTPSSNTKVQEEQKEEETKEYLKQFAGETKPLEVDYCSPTEAAQVSSNKIVVHFTQPMVALSAIGEGREAEKLLVVSPVIPGNFKWVNTKTLVFQAKGDLPYATHFTVTVKSDQASLLGSSLSRDLVFNFVTPAIAVLSATPDPAKTRPVGLKQTFALEMNQPVDPALIKTSLSLQQGNQQQVPFEVVCSKKNPKDPQTPKTCSTIQLTPTQELSKDTTVVLTVIKGAKGLGGPDLSEKDFVFSYQTHKDFEISGVSCLNGCRPPYASLDVNATTLLDRETFSKFVIFEPADVPLAQVYVYQNYTSQLFQIYFWPQATTHYTVTFKKGLQDEFGQKLKADVSFGFDSAHTEPLLKASNLEDQVSVYSDQLDFGFKATNLKTITAQFKRELTDQQIIQFFSARYVDSNRGLNFTEGWDKEMKFNGDVTDKLEPYAIPVKAVLGTKKTGIVLGKYVSPEYIAYNYNTKAYLPQPRWVLKQVTDLALDTKLSSKDALAWVTSLSTGDPVQQAQVRVYTRQGELLHEGKTDAAGLLKMPGSVELLSRAQNQDDVKTKPYSFLPFYIFAQTNDDRAFMSTYWTIESSYFVYGGFDEGYDEEGDYESEDGTDDEEEVQTSASVQSLSVRAHLLTDRGLYKPGEDVQMKGYLREISDAGLVPFVKPVTLSIKAAGKGQKPVTIPVTPNERGNFTASFHVPEGADLGSYRISVKPQDTQTRFEVAQISGTTFSVQEFRTPDFKTGVTLDRENYALGDSIKATFKTEYLFGAPMKGAQVQVSVDKKITSFTPKADREWSYGRLFEHTQTRSDFYQTTHENYEVVTNNEGLNSLDVKTVQTELDPMTYTLEGDVHDLSGQVQSGFAQVLIHPASFYIGAKTQHLFYTSGDPVSVTFAAISPDGKNLVDQKVAVDLMRVKWVNVKQETLDDQFETQTERKEERVDGCEKKTVKNENTCSFSVKESGYYFFALSAKDAQGRTAVTEVPFYLIGRGYAFWPSQDSFVIDLVPDKSTYQEGETAHVLVKSPYQSAKALVSIERDRVISYEIKDLQGSAPVIDIPIKSNFAPNIFVRVALIRGAKQIDPSNSDVTAALNQALVNVGTTELTVKPLGKSLNFSVAPNQPVYAPGDQATLQFEVKDLPSTENAEITVMVVDEGILLAGGYTLKDPLDTFFARYDHRVSQSDSRTHFVGVQSLDDKLAADSSGGGMSEQFRRNFIPLVYYNGAVVTKNGKAEVAFKIPDQLTSFKIMAIANAQVDQFGLAQTQIKTQKSVMIRPALPQFLRVGDRFDSRIVLHNNTDQELTAQMTVTAENLQVTSGNNGTIKLPARGTSSYSIQLATEANGLTEKIDEILKTDPTKLFVDGIVHMGVKAGSFSDQVEITLPIYLDRQIETVATSGFVNDSTLEVVNKSETADPHYGGLNIELSSNLLAQLKNRVQKLRLYPYDCLEQKMSALYPFVLFPDRNDLFTGKDQDAAYRKQQVNRFIQSLKREQSYDGEFAFWPGLPTHPELTLMVAEFLIQARSNGFNVEPVLEKIKDRIFDYLKDDYKMDPKSWFAQLTADDKIQLKIHSLYVLHLLGSPQPSRYQTFIDQKDTLPAVSLARLVEMVAANDPSAAFVKDWIASVNNQIRLKNNTAYLDSPIKNLSYFFGNTSRVATARFLQTLLKIDSSHTMVFPLLMYLVEEKNNSDYVASLETREVLRAVKVYLDVFPAAEQDVMATLFFNDQEKAKTQLNTQKPTDTVKVPIAEVPLDLAVKIKKDSGAHLFYNVLYTYALKSFRPFGIEQGISYAREFYDADGNKVAPNQLKHGQTYKVVINLFMADDAENFIIEEPVAAGLEPVNVALATSNRSVVDRCKVQVNDLMCFLNHKQMGQRVIRLFGSYVPRGFWEYHYFVNVTNRGDYLVPPGRALEMYSPEVFGTSAKEVVVVQ